VLEEEGSPHTKFGRYDEWWDMMHILPRIGLVAGYCEHDNEPSCSVKDRRFFEELSFPRKA
jgi:hypothetical protein